MKNLSVQQSFMFSKKTYSEKLKKKKRMQNAQFKVIFTEKTSLNCIIICIIICGQSSYSRGFSIMWIIEYITVDVSEL